MNVLSCVVSGFYSPFATTLVLCSHLIAVAFGWFVYMYTL